MNDWQTFLTDEILPRLEHSMDVSTDSNGEVDTEMMEEVLCNSILKMMRVDFGEYDV